MREIKAFIREHRVTEVVEALRKNDFRSMTLSEVEGTGRFTSKDDMPSLKFPVTHSKMVKLEMVCKKEDVKQIIQLICEHGSTGEKGDGIIYTSEVEQSIKIRTGEDNRDDL